MKLLPIEYAVRNLGRSPSRLAAGLLGASLVVLLTLAAAAFVRGMQTGLALSASDDNVILLGAGSEESVERSQIAANIAGLVEAAVPGIRRRFGAAYVSPEVQLALNVQRSADAKSPLPALMRGVTPAAFLVHPQVQLVEGRAPRAGHDELLIGALAHARLGVPAAELAVGESLWFDSRRWTIVGRFAAPNTVMNAELWSPLSDLQLATKSASVSCVVLTLDTAEFADLDAFCKQRLDLELTAIRERDYYAGLLAFYGPIRATVWITAMLVALGGLFGGLNTMYASFAARIREFGALQALGFSRRAILASLLQESLLTHAAGALIAAGLALLLLDRLVVRFSMGAFGLVVDQTVLAIGLGAGLAMGVLGALPPTWRVLRPAIPEALRAA